MEVCKSCDHNVIIECSGGCFSPHSTPPCFRQAMESQTTVVQQLKAEILALRKDGVVADDMYWAGWNMAIERAAGVLKLSAV